MSRIAFSLLALALFACAPTRDVRDDEDCEPRSCTGLGKNCGEVSDGCDGTLSCGVCTAPETCAGGGTANVCGAPAQCVPETDAALCVRLARHCGAASGVDNCEAARTVANCGTCADGLSCNGGTCGGTCAPENDRAMCERLGRSCAPVTDFDNCGDSRVIASCGACTGGLSCVVDAAGSHCAGWSAMTSPTTRRLWQVTGSSSTNVWAGGDGGTLLRFDGTRWSVAAIPTTSLIRGIAVLSPTDVWVASVDRQLFHWDGAAWTTVANPVPTSNYSDLWALSATQIYAVGERGVILRWNGAAWAQEPTPWTSTAVKDLYSVWGTGASNIWASGVGGSIVRWNGTAWSQLAAPATLDYVTVWGSGPTNMLFLGDPGPGIDNQPYRFDGFGFAAITVAQSDPKHLHGVNGHDLWAVGDLGGISHWDGEAWSSVTSPTTLKLEAVWASSEQEAFAVGASGTILRYRK